MKKTEPVTVTISALGADGYGHSSLDGLSVSGVLSGETVIAQPFTRKRRRTFARAQQIIEASADRITPLCAAADICGGCSFQHFEPGAQIQFKQDQLIAALGACQPDELSSPLVGPMRGYRSKARLGVKYVAKKGVVLVGFREKMSPYLAELERCDVLAAPVGDLIGPLAALIDTLSVRSLIPQIEVAVGDDGAALVFRHLGPLSDSDTQSLLAFADEQDVAVYLQPGNAASVWKLAPADGNDRLTYALPEHDIVMGFHPLDFTQVNRDINRALVSLALAELDLVPQDRVLDLFCGIGNFSLVLARRAAEVRGMELSEDSVDRARENATRNHISNCFFETGDLFAENHTLPLEGVTKVLIDPPRSGAYEVCKRLASSKVERVVYVSCNPDTLARDASILVENGYRMNKAGVIDMFPHTTHVESFASFSSR